MLPDNPRRMLVTVPMAPMWSQLIAEMPLLMPSVLIVTTSRMLTPKVQTVMASMVPMMNSGAGIHTMNLRDPLRGRAFRSNLRFAPISAAIPVASAPFGRCALRLPNSRHAVPNVRTPRRTSASLSSPRRFAQRSSQTSPRSPWPAAPAAGFASGSVLCTTACGSRRTDRHSFAVPAPLRRVPRRRLPLRSPSDSWLFLRPAACGSHTPRSSLQGRAMVPYVLPFPPCSAPFGVWRLLDRACNAPRLAALTLLSPHAYPER